MFRKPNFVIVTVFLFSLCFAGQVMAAEGPHWGYEGEIDPLHWGELSPDYSTCSTGTEQSPIDIPTSAPVNTQIVPFNYQISAIDILDNGHTILVSPDQGSSIEVDGKTYHLLQFHFHAPSEHTMDGAAAPMEAHFVHQNDEGGLAVVGIFLIEGDESTGYAPLFENLPPEVSLAQALPENINVIDLLPPNRSYIRYNGSLTTPPCTEGVKWFILKDPVKLSSNQIAAFTAIYDGNYRPTLPMNERQFVEGLAPKTLPATGAPSTTL